MRCQHQARGFLLSYCEGRHRLAEGEARETESTLDTIHDHDVSPVIEGMALAVKETSKPSREY